MKHFIILILIAASFLFQGCVTKEKQCKDECKGSNESCFFLMNMILNPSTLGGSGTTTSEFESNNTFDVADSISIPSNYSGNSTTLNGYISSAVDTDIFYLSSFTTATTLKIEKLSGNASCEMFVSPVKSTSTTTTPDTPPLSSRGQVTYSSTNIILDSTNPYLYIKCTDVASGSYSIKFTASSSSSLNSSSFFNFFTLLVCSDAEGSCVRDCMGNK